MLFLILQSLHDTTAPQYTAEPLNMFLHTSSGCRPNHLGRKPRARTQAWPRSTTHGSRCALPKGSSSIAAISREDNNAGEGNNSCPGRDGSFYPNQDETASSPGQSEVGRRCKASRFFECGSKPRVDPGTRSSGADRFFKGSPKPRVDPSTRSPGADRFFECLVD